jgi:hypothetical protein
MCKKSDQKQARKFGPRNDRKFFVFFVSFVVNFTGFQSMSDKRKILEQRATMTDIEPLRHLASHLLAFCHVEQSRDISYYFP